MASIISTQSPQLPPMVSGWPQPQMPPAGATGWPQPKTTSTPELINQIGSQANGLIDAGKDIFTKGNGLVQVVANGTQQTNEAAPKDKSKRNKALAVAILLIGGVALGYGHKNQISKGVDSAKNWLNTGKTGEWIQKGKGVLTGLKDKIMTKPPVA